MRHEKHARLLPGFGAWRTVAAAVAAFGVGLAGPPARAAEKKKAPKIIPAHADGSRTPPVHRIQLFDSDDALIKVHGKRASAEPLSAEATCYKCHEVDNIRRGWHFNAPNPKIDPGRNGEPWILVDRATGTQVPLSSRKWPGTFRPADLEMGNWDFVQNFGRQMPGGGAGVAEFMHDRTDQSGALQINCLGCHNAQGNQDQTAWAVNVGKYNFRWAATAASGLALVKGNVSSFPPEVLDIDMDDPDHPERIPMEVEYFASQFDSDNFTILDLVRKPAASRCYFCHSTNWAGADTPRRRWQSDQDVHLAAGLTCTDCHRNDEFHHIVRGDEGEKSAGEAPPSLTCRGCHMGDGSDRPAGLPGRLGAPYPKHTGLPTIHLDKLACTACHSGPWPRKRAGRVQTSRSHGLGVHGKHTADPVLPYIASPVFMRGPDDKIGPHHIVWPAYWGLLKDKKVRPLPIAKVAKAGKGILPKPRKGAKSKRYTPPTPEQIARTLAKLGGGDDGQPVYVAGGELYRLGKDGALSDGEAHAAAEPYAWPFAHDVRPAGKSLGVGGATGCEDCHTTDSPMFFGEVLAEAPAPVGKANVKKMHELLGEDGTYWKLFAMSFVFRPMLKIVGFASAAIIGAILLLYGLRALRAFLARFGVWTRPGTTRKV